MIAASTILAQLAMSLEITDKELAAVCALDPARRYDYFLKRVADWEQAWALYDRDWLAYTQADARVWLPVWPARRYAEECRILVWMQAAPRPIALGSLLTEVLCTLVEHGRGVAVFPVGDPPVAFHVEPARLLSDLQALQDEWYGE